MLAGTLVVLAVTGVWLWFRYVPSASAAWSELHLTGDTQGWIRPTHRIASWFTILLATIALVMVIGRRLHRGRSGIIAGVGLVVTALAASFTGHLLPWDQLALWAVTVGNDVKGVQAIFRGEIKYILIGSHEVSPGTYRVWAISHVVVGVLVAVTVVLVWLRTRRSSSTRDDDRVRASAIET
jgi:quinol-cytochrome oxidoreductase complex cytochrome b subunit